MTILSWILGEEKAPQHCFFSKEVKKNFQKSAIAK
jgi:hypothetical protein